MRLSGKKALFITLVTAICLITTSVAYSATCSLVYLSNGKLVYTTYANQGQTNSVNTIPDFSYCGYMGGGVAIPNISVKTTVSPVSGDNTSNIQNAINYVAGLTPDANGFRGTVYLSAGTYNVNGPININTSGVVLRGAGQGTNGTILMNTNTTQNNLVKVYGTSTAAWNEVSGTRQTITTSYVPTGAKSFSIASASGYNVGDSVIVLRTPNDAWITALDMAQYGWTAADYQVGYERKITAVSGNQITIDIPVVQAMETGYGGGCVFKYTTTGRINKCGVEDIRFDSVYSSDTDENHGWNAIDMKYVEDSWVRNVTAVHYGYACVHMADAVRRVTVQDCAMKDPISQLTGGRRYSFCIEGKSSANLIQRCYTRDGRHDYVTGSRVPGPNVFLDSYATVTHADIGPHHRYATGILFDNISGGQIYVQNRGAMGTGHGWAGAQTVFWNSYASSAMKVESPLGAKNFGLGGQGGSQVGAGYWEDWGSYEVPRSLYLQQLQDRLGTTAVDNIAAAQQKNGSVWSILESWAGEGKSPLAGDTALVNLALNKTASASSIWSSSYAASNAFDGSGSTRWSAASGQVSNQWLSIDFGGNTAYDQVVVKETSYQRVTSYKLQSSSDGTNYTDIPGTSGTTIGSSKTISFSPVSSRYLRLYMSTSSDVPTINEMEVYSSDPATPAAWYSKVSYSEGTQSLGSNNTGTKTAEFDLTPSYSGIDGLVGYADSSTAVSAATSLAMIIRVNTSGSFDARNGGAYAALATVPYSANNTYHVKMVANLTAQTYSVWVTPPGGSATQIASNYSFRTDAPATDDLGQVCIRTASANDQMKVENHTLY